jgi:transposase-like protein
MKDFKENTFVSALSAQPTGEKAAWGQAPTVCKTTASNPMNNQPDKRPDGVPRRPYLAELKERAYQLYLQGKPNREIANELQIPINTINRWSCKEKWKLRKRLAGRPGTGLGLAPNSPLTGDAKKKEEEQCARDREKTLPEAQVEYEETMQAQALRMARIVSETPDALLITSADKIAKLDVIARKALKLETDRPRTLINIAMLAAGNIKPTNLGANLTPVAQITYDGDAECNTVAQLTDGTTDSAAEPSPGPDLPVGPSAPEAGL